MAAASYMPFITLLAAHLLGDFYAAFYGPLVPVLRDRLHISVVSALTLATLYGVTSNFLQPVFGMVGERFGRRRLLALGIAGASVGMAGLGFGANVPLIALMLVIGGIGVGMFHPCGAALAGQVGGARKSSAIAMYMVGGNLGVMLSPLIVPPLAQMDLRYVALLAIPGLVFSVWLWRRPLDEEPPHAPAAGFHVAGTWETFRRVWPVFVDVILRFMPVTLFSTLLPLYDKLRGMDNVEAGRPLAAFMLAGGVGVLAGGWMSGRVRHLTLVVLSETCAGVCFFLAPMCWGAAYYVLLCVGAFCAYSLMSVQIAAAQRLAPRTEGAASGIVMGLAYGIGSLALIPMGWLSDHWTATLGVEVWAVTLALQTGALSLFLAAGLALCIRIPEHDGAEVSKA
jgi:FSR family fosmidomycin resistance protein-like MFS transporter